MHSHPHLHPHDLIWLYFRLFRPNQLVSFVSSPPWLSYTKPKWFYGCQSWQGNSDSAQWPLLFTSYSKVNTPARTQQDCWSNSFLLSWKCVCVSVCSGSVCAQGLCCEFKATFWQDSLRVSVVPLKGVVFLWKRRGFTHSGSNLWQIQSICVQVHLSLHGCSVEAHSLPKVAVTAPVMEPGVEFQWYKQSCLCVSEGVTYPWQFLPHTDLFFPPIFTQQSVICCHVIHPVKWNVFSRNCHTLGWGTLRKLEIVSRHFYGFCSVNIMITVRMNGCKLDPVFLPWPRPDIQAP